MGMAPARPGAAWANFGSFGSLSVCLREKKSNTKFLAEREEQRPPRRPQGKSPFFELLFDFAYREHFFLQNKRYILLYCKRVWSMYMLDTPMALIHTSQAKMMKCETHAQPGGGKHDQISYFWIHGHLTRKYQQPILRFNASMQCVSRFFLNLFSSTGTFRSMDPHEFVSEFSKAEVSRYSRQLLVPEVRARKYTCVARHSMEQHSMNTEQIDSPLLGMQNTNTNTVMGHRHAK
jgi:hypothetical protein